MARPVEQKISTIALKTNEGNAPKVGVFQSLDVRASSKNADLANGLKDILGVGMTLGAEHIKQRSETEATQGIADASLGRIDDERLKKGLAYRAGIETVTAKRTVLEAKSAWDQHYAENIDKRMPTEDVAREYDSFMKERLGAVAEGNAKFAAKMAPEYMRGMQELVVGHQSRLTKQFLDEAVLVAQAEMADRAAAGLPIEAEAHVNTIYGISGDAKLGTDTVVQTIGVLAMTTGNVKVLDEIPIFYEDGDGKKHSIQYSPEQRARIEQFREAADRKRLENLGVERIAQKMGIEKRWMDMQAAGLPVPWEELTAQNVEDSVFGQNELMAYYAKNLALENANRDATQLGTVREGVPYYNQVGMVDDFGKKITQERVQDHFNRSVEARLAALQEQMPEADPIQLMAIAATAESAQHSMAYEPLKSAFMNAPLSDPQAFIKYGHIYAEQIPPHMRATFVPDKDRRMLFAEYQRRKDSMGAQKAAEVVAQMAQGDPDVMDENVRAARPGIDKAARDIDKLFLRDTAWFWQDADVQMKEVVNKNYASARLKATAVDIARRTGVDGEIAVKMASEELMSTHMLVQSGKGFRLFPLIEGVSMDIGQAVEWLEAEALPKLAASRGINVPQGSYLSFDPSNHGNKQLVVIGPDLYPIRPDELRFDPRTLEQEYAKFKTTDAYREMVREREQRGVLRVNPMHQTRNGK
jgi:hypothetical protein